MVDALKTLIDDEIASQGPGFIAAEDTDDICRAAAVHVARALNGAATVDEAMEAVLEWRELAKAA